MTEVKTTAKQLLEQLNSALKDSVTVSVGGVEFKFIRDNAAYDSMINEVDAGNKVTPIKDYLLAIVDRSQREDLLSVINLPGLALNLAAKVNQELIPKFELAIKN